MQATLTVSESLGGCPHRDGALSRRSGIRGQQLRPRPVVQVIQLPGSPSADRDDSIESLLAAAAGHLVR